MRLSLAAGHLMGLGQSSGSDTVLRCWHQASTEGFLDVAGLSALSQICLKGYVSPSSHNSQLQVPAGSNFDVPCAYQTPPYHASAFGNQAWA